VDFTYGTHWCQLQTQPSSRNITEYSHSHRCRKRRVTPGHHQTRRTHGHSVTHGTTRL